jgi:hypothetical protein
MATMRESVGLRGQTPQAGVPTKRRRSVDLEDKYGHRASGPLTIDLGSFGFSSLSAEPVSDAQRRDIVDLDV